MIGAIAGDVIGSAFEWRNIKSKKFELFSRRSAFTDDTVLTVAVADCILSGNDYATTFREYGQRYPNAGYGSMFAQWLFSENMSPYNSFGNGSAMRVSPVGFALDNLEDVLNEAKKSAEVTHNHPEGIKGAQAIAATILLSRQGADKKDLRSYISNTFGYDLTQTLDVIRPNYRFDETCQGSVPQAIIAFLESTDYEDTIRNAISLGGDSDTIACMAGGIAQAYYKIIPDHIVEPVRGLLEPALIRILDSFQERYMLQTK